VDARQQGRLPMFQFTAIDPLALIFSGRAA
jgi:hypothetical protein